MKAISNDRVHEAFGILSGNIINRPKAKFAVVTPRVVASPLALRAAQTLIDASSGMRSLPANYPPIESSRPADDMVVSKFILKRHAITRFVRDALQSTVDKQKENAGTNGR